MDVRRNYTFRLKNTERPEKFSRKLIDILRHLCFPLKQSHQSILGLVRISKDVFTFPHPVFKQNHFAESSKVQAEWKLHWSSSVVPDDFELLCGVQLSVFTSILTFSTQTLYINAFMRLPFTTRKTKRKIFKTKNSLISYFFSFVFRFFLFKRWVWVFRQISLSLNAVISCVWEFKVETLRNFSFCCQVCDIILSIVV